MALGQATAHADDPQVRYTLTSAGPADFDLYYVATQPPSKEAYNSDPYAYLKRETVFVAPDAPWSFVAPFADPQWALLTVSSTTHGGQAAPNPHCEIAINDQIAVQQDGPYNLQCQLSQW